MWESNMDCPCYASKAEESEHDARSVTDFGVRAKQQEH